MSWRAGLRGGRPDGRGLEELRAVGAEAAEISPIGRGGLTGVREEVDDASGLDGDGLSETNADEVTPSRGRRPIRVLEWTPNDHLRHSSFVALRDDKDPRAVVKEDETTTERKASQIERVDRKRQRA